MKRVSFGVILDGDPNCIQKNNLWIKMAEKICLYGWIVAAVAAAITIITAFLENSARTFCIGFGLIGSTVFLGVCCLLWGEKVRCSYCGHFLTLRRISGDQFLDSSEREISRTAYDSGSGVVMDSDGNSAYYTSLSSHREYGTEVTKRYAYNVRCSCCGSVIKVEKSRTSEHY